MKKMNFILPIFMRWLKTKNIYGLFLYNAYKFPIEDYTIENWLEYINGEKCHGNMKTCHLCLISQIPFTWADTATLPIEANESMTKSTFWTSMSYQWKEYLIKLNKEKHLYD